MTDDDWKRANPGTPLNPEPEPLDCGSFTL